MNEKIDHFDRVISNQVRFGYGYQLIDGSMVYYAWHGYPNRNDDYFTTSQISKHEFRQIEQEYPYELVADRKTAEIFRQKYIEGHKVLKEGWHEKGLLLYRDNNK